MLSRSEIAY